uniref:Uncharacterized protein n=1 Tax=uncultured Armatimonadetes bacterium TaxID=157466 RepID=A0A6J4IFC4_9BACT|nr:hypothetical protein AVDCRST_MAG63-1829 [uncultured Armatimonadetes bacterium]
MPGRDSLLWSVILAVGNTFIAIGWCNNAIHDLWYLGWWAYLFAAIWTTYAIALWISAIKQYSQRRSGRGRA